MSNRIKANKARLSIAKIKSEDLYNTLKAAAKFYDDFFKSISMDNVSAWSSNPIYIANVKKKIAVPKKPNPNYDASDPIKRLCPKEIDDVDQHNKLVIAAINEKAEKINSLVEKLEYKERINDSRIKIRSFKNDISNLDTYINDFETFNVSFKKELDAAFNSAELGDSSVKIETIKGVDGSEISYVTIKNGEDGEYELLSEQVNCAFTFLGISSSGLVEIANLASNYASENGKYVDSAKLDELLFDYVKETGSVTSSYLQKGFFSVATSEGIGNLYTAATGTEYNEEQVETDYNNLMAYMASDMLGMDLTEKVNSGEIGAMAMAGLVGSAINKKGQLTDEEKEKAGLEEYVGIDGNKDKNIPGTVLWPDNSISDDLSLNSGEMLNVSDISSNLVNNDSDLKEDLLDEFNNNDNDNDNNIDDSFQTDYEADRILDMMDDLDDSKLPSMIDPDTRTAAEIDSEARDEYFDEMGDELYEQRAEQVEQYQSMSDDQKLSVFEEMGYSKEDAAKLIAAPAAGQTAYVYGKLNETLSMNANKIATAEGVNNFISGYDSKNTISNIANKTANVELTPTSDKVQAARQQLTTVKNTYDDSVTKANKAIDKADDAKKNYNKVLKNIQDKNGEDPKNWTDEQVRDYNDAATMYNDAVKEAQEAAENVESAKTMYNQEKDQYQEIYEKWKKEAEEDVGDTGNSFNDIKAETNEIKEPVSDKVDDTSINIGTGNNSSSSNISSGNTSSNVTSEVSNSQPSSGNNSVAVDNDSINIGPTTDSGINVNHGEQTSQFPTDSVEDTSINIGTNDNINLTTDDKPVMNVNVEATTDNISYNE